MWVPAVLERPQGRALHPQTCPAGLAIPSIFLGYRRGISCTATPTANSQRAWDQDSSPEMPENAVEPRHGFKSSFPRKKVPGTHPQEPSPSPFSTRDSSPLSTLGCDFLKARIQPTLLIVSLSSPWPSHSCYLQARL